MQDVDTNKANHPMNLLKSAKVRWPDKTAEEYAEGAIRALTQQRANATSLTRIRKLDGAIQRWTEALEELRK